MSIESKLLKFINDHSHLSEQGSQQWLDERQLMIGGSEIATITGKNRFSSIQNLIAQKIGLSSFLGNRATRWGNLFEDMTELIFSTLFLNNEKIYTTGSIANKDIPEHKYSPDGLCTMTINEVLYTILLEFKSPLSTIPSGKIPPHYLPQVKAGLCTLELTDKAIFVNNMFRKCTLSDLDYTTKYDHVFHKDADKNLKIDQALACGMIMFYISGEQIDAFLAKVVEEKERDESNTNFNQKNNEFACSDSDSDYSSESASDSDQKSEDIALNSVAMQALYNNVSLFLDGESDADEYALLDIGALAPYEMDEWLELYKPINGASFLTAKYIKPNINVKYIGDGCDNLYLSPDLNKFRTHEHLEQLQHFNFQKTITKYKSNCIKKGLIPVAVLPWKLLKSDVISVDKEPDFLKPHKADIQRVIGTIKKIIGAGPLLDDHAEAFMKEFPDSNAINYYLRNRPMSQAQIDEFTM